MAQVQTEAPFREPLSPSEPHSPTQQQSLWRRLIFGRDKDHGSPAPSDSKGTGSDQSGIIRRVSRKVVPGLPRAQTFKRQQSELRDKLEPVQQTPAERRAVSMDRRMHSSAAPSLTQSNPRTSAPDFLQHNLTATASVPSLPASHVDEKAIDGLEHLDVIRGEWEDPHDAPAISDAISLTDGHSISTSQYDNMIHDELERIWILNLSMHFRDKSKREKFFVTYREHETLWRRVTISLDYRNAPENSLEMELVHTKFQRDKSAKIYEAIRESLADIQFYNTVTNLKLQTTDGRLHVHVVEDVNEIINYPTMRMIQHMRCRRVKEREIEFDSHLSGFVYKVRVNGEVLIKKEIPGPDTVDEFLYEINALNRLRFANNVIQFYGVIVDDKEEHVKGLLISYAEQGALIDVLYDGEHSIPWNTREKWARQIVNGLAEIHEAGFVQGDFTLSNIVVNDDGDAKIIDINRRGCPVGWEPPEATPLIESNQRISMYIGVKSDLFQLGMVLWALATQEDEPEAHGRPLRIGADLKVPPWYRRIVEICLSEDPRHRIQALHLLSMFPDIEEESEYGHPRESSISVDQGYSRPRYFGEFGGSPIPEIKTVQPPHDWAYVGWGNRFSNGEDPYSYPTRGRSPPSPMPSNHRGFGSPPYEQPINSWSDNNGAQVEPSLNDLPNGVLNGESEAHHGATDDAIEVVVDEASAADLPRISVEVDEASGADKKEVQEEFPEKPGESSQTRTKEDTRATPESGTPPVLAGKTEAMENIPLDVSGKPNSDADRDGAEQKILATTKLVCSNDEPQDLSATIPSSVETEEDHVAGVQKLVDELAESLVIPGKLDSADAATPSVLTSSQENAISAKEADTVIEGNTEASTNATPPRAINPSVPNALTGIELAHHHLDSESGRAGPGAVPDDDDFGIGSFAKNLEMTTATMTTETETETETRIMTTAGSDDNEHKQKD
ncbi:serine threonine protein kinase [Naviculisporaceae sp. PSN 640]